MLNDRAFVRQDDFQDWVDREVECALRPTRERARPWWWWLALGVASAWTLTAIWIAFRTAAGHPWLGGLKFAG